MCSALRLFYMRMLEKGDRFSGPFIAAPEIALQGCTKMLRVPCISAVGLRVSAASTEAFIVKRAGGEMRKLEFWWSSLDITQSGVAPVFHGFGPRAWT